MPLGATSTLLVVRSNVRAITLTQSVQFSGLLEGTLTDLINDAVRLVRGLARNSLRNFYYTEFAATIAASIDLSSINIFDPTSMRLVLNSDNSQIPIVPRNVYNNMLQLHTFTTGQWIATLTTTAAGTFGLLVGGAATPAGAGTLAFERNPTKATADATVLDIPDQLVPIVQDIACLNVWRSQNKQPLADVLQRVRLFTDEQLRGTRLTKESQ
jgi:hypothetical protein